MRVLCLHGYTQNAERFRARTGPFRRGLKRSLELVYMTAPHAATDFQPQSTEAEPDGPSAAWWNRSGDVWAEIRLSIQSIGKVIREQGPFDGILGFSQGSGMAAVLLALLQAARKPEVLRADAEVAAAVQDLSGCPELRFAFLFAGFYPDLPQFDRLTRGHKIQIPSLHMVGMTDAIVPRERGEQLAQQAFADALLLTHEGGHFVPCNAAWRKQYQAFIDKLPQETDEASIDKLP
ncbi:Ovarian cancer-associated protein 2 [Coemansia sp. RSA 552]|nr:Ovarian cancer-associated protein 2 [Coemansia sp. RSA 552]